MKQTLKLKWLIVGAFLSSIGTSFIWPLTTIYLHNELHRSLTVIGVVLLLYSGTNVVGSYLGGILFDRFNPQSLILVGLLVDIAAMVALVFHSGWPQYPTLLAVIGFFNGWLTTLVNSMGTLIRNKDGRYIFNMLYFAVNLGIVLGTSVVGFMYHGSVAPMFMVTASLYVVFLVIVVRFYRIKREKGHQKQQQAAQRVRIKPANLKIMWTFFISLTIIWVMYEQWVSNMSVYITDQGISMPLYSMLWTINASLIVVMQLFMSWANQRIKNVYLPVYVGALFCGASFIILIWAHQYWMFLVAMIILTVGEATAFPAIPAIVNDLSPMAVKGKYQGLTNAFSSAGKALGPLFGGLVIENASYRMLFVVCAIAIFMVTAIIYAIVQVYRQRVEYYR